MHARTLAALVGALAVSSALFLAGCTAPAVSVGTTHGIARASDALDIQVTNASKSGAHRHELVRASVRGESFDGASRVAVEVLNTSDPKARALNLEAHRSKGGSWSATIEPATAGTGTWRVTMRALDAQGGELDRAEETFTYCATFETSGKIVLAGGDYELTYGTAGLKVLRVQKVVGVGLDRYPRYLEATTAAVRDFQSRNGLEPTGVVDQQTWLAMGLDPIEWYALGAYVSPSTVGRHAGRSERIDAMIARAYEYLGDRYEWDASGAPGQGVDCAGLVIQALYAAGCDTGIVNPVTHATTTWGDQDALNMYAYCNLTEIAYEDRARGDLVFYSLAGTGSVDHVAIYLGDNQVIEAHPAGVRVSSLTYAPVIGVRRVFA